MPKTAANRNNITAISIRKDHGRRGLTGRAGTRGKEPECWETAVVEVTRSLDLGQREFAGRGIVVKNLGVTAPLYGRLQLPARFGLTEMFIDEVVEEFVREGAIGFGLQGLLHLAQQGNMCEACCSK